MGVACRHTVGVSCHHVVGVAYSLGEQLVQDQKAFVGEIDERILQLGWDEEPAGELTKEDNNNKYKQKLVGQQSQFPSNHGDNHVEYTKVKRKHGIR